MNHQVLHVLVESVCLSAVVMKAKREAYFSAIHSICYADNIIRHTIYCIYMTSILTSSQNFILFIMYKHLHFCFKHIIPDS